MLSALTVECQGWVYGSTRRRSYLDFECDSIYLNQSAHLYQPWHHWANKQGQFRGLKDERDHPSDLAGGLCRNKRQLLPDAVTSRYDAIARHSSSSMLHHKFWNAIPSRVTCSLLDQPRSSASSPDRRWTYPERNTAYLDILSQLTTATHCRSSSHFNNARSAKTPPDLQEDFATIWGNL